MKNKMRPIHAGENRRASRRPRCACDQAARTGARGVNLKAARASTEPGPCRGRDPDEILCNEKQRVRLESSGLCNEGTAFDLVRPQFNLEKTPNLFVERCFVFTLQRSTFDYRTDLDESPPFDLGSPLFSSAGSVSSAVRLDPATQKVPPPPAGVNVNIEPVVAHIPSRSPLPPASGIAQSQPLDVLVQLNLGPSTNPPQANAQDARPTTRPRSMREAYDATLGEARLEGDETASS
jgi:hypothetical protein